MMIYDQFFTTFSGMDLFITLFGMFFLIIICREILCWYWKQTKQVKELKKIRKLLEQMMDSKACQIKPADEAVKNKSGSAEIK